jgi:hypothetical protein
VGVGLAAQFLNTEPEDWDWIVRINVMGHRPRLPPGLT